MFGVVCGGLCGCGGFVCFARGVGSLLARVGLVRTCVWLGQACLMLDGVVSGLSVLCG